MNRFRFIPGAVLLVGCLAAGMASAQTPANVVPILGNGQLICQACAQPIQNQGSFQLMTVLVTDASGNPIPNATVNWAVTSGGFGGQLTQASTTVTDQNGQSSNIFFPGFLNVGTAFTTFFQTTISATSGSVGTTFTLTQALSNQLNLSAQPVQIFDVSQLLGQRPDLGPAQQLTLGTTISGRVGTTATIPIKIFVGDGNSVGIPNVAVNLYDLQPASAGPNVQCGPDPTGGPNSAINGTVLSGANGIATCYPQFSGVPGVQGQFNVMVGANESTLGDPTLLPPSNGLGFKNLNVTVTPGVAATFTVVSGSGQSGQAGTALGAPLVAQVLATGGGPLAGQTVTWSVSPVGSATLGNATTTTDGNGKATNIVTLSATASGTVQVTAKLSGSTLPAVVFSLSAIQPVTITGFTAVSGSNQATVVGAAFAAPLVVQVTASAGSAANLPVQFTVNGPATLSASTATTNNSGQAQVTVTAGTTAGAVTVTATVAGFGTPVTFNLTVSPPGPTLTAASFINGADLQRGGLSPCGIGAVSAAGVAPGVQNTIFPSSVIGPVPTILGGNQVLVNSIASPILGLGINPNTGQQQITFQVPCETTAGSSVPITVNVGAGTASINVPVQAAAPGVFTTLLSDNALHTVVVRPGGDFVTIQNPARKGETVVAFVTGLGPSIPAVATGALPPPGITAIPQYQVVAGMSGGGVPLISTQLSPDRVGVWMLTFQIPAGISSTNGLATFSIAVIPTGASSSISSGTTTIPVQ